MLEFSIRCKEGGVVVGGGEGAVFFGGKGIGKALSEEQKFTLIGV